MDWLTEFLWRDHFWLALPIMLASVVLISSFADRRRHKRTNIENVGFMPWTAITVFSVLGTVLSAALAIKGL